MKFQLLSIIAITFSLSCFAQQNSVSKKPAYKKYNILFLFADDQRQDALGCYNNTYIRTPNIDKLATSGVRFTNNYVMGGNQGAICAPSRAMLMSGKSLFHVYDHLEDVHTMPMEFAEHGYETFGTGKWHNGASTFEASFQKGDEVFLGGMANHYKVPCRTLSADRKLSAPVVKGYSTDLFADAAINYLNSYAKGKKDKSFFCYVAFTAPHDPRSPRKDYIDMYPPASIPLPGNFMKLHPFQFDYLNIRDETLAPWPRTPEIIQESLADYYALITHLDSRVGDIIETLKKQGLYENTIIIYAADNGLSIGSHGLMGKQDLYEESTKVPLIISGPGIPKNQIRDAMVYLYDIYPTLSDLCGLPSPNGVDGLDFAKVLLGKEKETRKSLYTAYRNTARGVRNDEWKRIRYPQRDYTQLFNLKKDPLEINNLAELPENKTKVTEMMTLLNHWYVATNDTATMHPSKILPLEYDYKKLKQIPDKDQPQYILDKYFKGVDLKQIKKSEEN
jgi:arylsulfatase A-like enzyme